MSDECSHEGKLKSINYWKIPFTGFLRVFGFRKLRRRSQFIGLLVALAFVYLNTMALKDVVGFLPGTGQSVSVDAFGWPLQYWKYTVFLEGGDSLVLKELVVDLLVALVTIVCCIVFCEYWMKDRPRADTPIQFRLVTVILINFMGAVILFLNLFPVEHCRTTEFINKRGKNIEIHYKWNAIPFKEFTYHYLSDSSPADVTIALLKLKEQRQLTPFIGYYPFGFTTKIPNLIQSCTISLLALFLTFIISESVINYIDRRKLLRPVQKI